MQIFEGRKNKVIRFLNDYPIINSFSQILSYLQSPARQEGKRFSKRENQVESGMSLAGKVEA